MANQKSQIQEQALQLLAQEPSGIRWAVLLKKVQALMPDVKSGAIQPVVAALPSERPKDVHKPARGLFQHMRYKDNPPSGNGAALAATEVV